MLNVSVVICAYTEKRWLALTEAIKSIQAQKMPALEIIVVVDHNPALATQVRLNFPGIIVVENKGNRGLSDSRNSGITVACGEVLAFMDDDAIATPEWLSTLVESYNDPRVLGVGGSIEPRWSDARPLWLPEEFFWVVGCTYRGMPRTSAPVRNLIGCNMSFRYKVFEAIGGFRNSIGRVGTLPAGCEETELCIRVRQHWAECELRYEPSARVHHHVPDNRQNWNYFRSRCYHEGRSKAIMTQWTGTKDGLSSERTYMLRTIPIGILQNLWGMEKQGLVRAGIMIGGLAITAIGYLKEKLRSGRTTPLRRAVQF